MSTALINGRAAALPDDPEALLVDVLRDTLRLTGTKLVCGSGVCGACAQASDPVSDRPGYCRTAAEFCAGDSEDNT